MSSPCRGRRLDRLRFHDPAKNAVDLASMPDDELHIVARNSETLALLTWEPYMHNPKLNHRLHRVNVPTLFLRGASDGIVSAEYLERYAALVPKARIETIAEAGHLPQVEQPVDDRCENFAILAELTRHRDIRSKVMKAWHFSENAYPYLPPADEYESIRVSLPNRIYDPKKGAALYDRYIDEWLVAEDEGVEIMLNEHHQTATCVDPAAPLVLAALARMTKKARLLILGNPVANRRQPVRVAEEMAMVDVLSKGRLECGFVRGVPYEVLPANSNPVRMNERQWEAMDLIVKAWTSHDGPVSHEGRFFHHRNINIWPRPYQQPHPPIWVSTTTPGRCRPRRRARLRAGDVSDRLRRHARDLQLLPQGLARGRPRRGRSRQPAGLCGARLYRRERKRGARGRREAPLVHDRQQGAAALLLSARLRADAGAREDPARRGRSISTPRTGPMRPWTRRSRPASCSPAPPTRSFGRSRKCTTTSAASGIS